MTHEELVEKVELAVQDAYCREQGHGWGAIYEASAKAAIAVVLEEAVNVAGFQDTVGGVIEALRALGHPKEGE